MLDFYDMGSPQQRRLILKTLNSHVVKSGVLKPAEIDLEWPNDLTIEHIMPRALDPTWRKLLATEIKERRLDGTVDDLHRAHVNLIGNLTLARHAPNASYSNRPYDQKVELINKQLAIRLNSELGKAPYLTWGFDAIQRRSQALAKLACAVWSGPLRAS